MNKVCSTMESIFSLGVTYRHFEPFDQATQILGWSTDSSKLIAVTDDLVLADTKGSQKPIEFSEDDLYWYSLAKWVSPSSFLIIEADETSTLYIVNVNGQIKIIDRSDSGITDLLGMSFDVPLID